jgi:hypothetical protein
MGESKSPALPLGDAPIAAENADKVRCGFLRPRRSIERHQPFQPPKATVSDLIDARRGVEGNAVSWEDGINA